jgi:hypothetical protein
MKLNEIILIGYPLAISISLQVIFAKFIIELLVDIFGFQLY